MSEAAKEQVVVRETGRVKWFNAAKGFGFICFPGNREGIFCHFSQVQVDGYNVSLGQTTGGPKVVLNENAQPLYWPATQIVRE